LAKTPLYKHTPIWYDLIIKFRRFIMAQYVCSLCGYVYDEEIGIPEEGIAAGTKWEDIPDDFVCPMCGADKSMFEKQ
jgi:Rubredoxin